MSNLLRRLQKLEARLTDRSGLVPNAQGWLEYWLRPGGFVPRHLLGDLDPALRLSIGGPLSTLTI